MLKFLKNKKSFSYQLFEAIFIILPIAFLIRTFGYGLYQVPTGSMETTMLVGERFFADKFTVLFRELKRGDIISFNDPTFKYSDNYWKQLWQRYVWGPSNYTKRLIALPGDEIKGDIEDGKPVVYLKKKGETEFQKLDEPYLNKFPLIATANTESYRVFTYKSYDPNYSYSEQPFYKMTEKEVELGKVVASKLGKSQFLYPQTPLIEGGDNKDIYNKVLGEDEYWGMGDNRLYSADSRFFGPINKKLIHGKIVYRIFSLDFESNAWWEIWLIDLIKNPIEFWKRVRWSRCFQVVR